MIRRTVKLQLVAFVVISIIGIAYVGSNYVGFRFPWQGGPYTVHMMLTSSGGIFSNAEGTERGVTVGRVGKLTLKPGGVDVELNIDHGKQIPSDLHATVANLSAVGEQYVDLEPKTDSGPYLHDGSRIDAADTTVPLDDAPMLVDLDKLVTSVDRPHLATVIDELGKGFDNL